MSQTSHTFPLPRAHATLAPLSPALNSERDDASSEGGDAANLSTLARASLSSPPALNSLITQELARLTVENEELRRALAARDTALAASTRRVAELEDSASGASGATQALKDELGELRRTGKRQATELRRLQLQETASRKASKLFAYTATLATVPVSPHDRVMIRYTKPIGMVAIGAVQPKPHEENATGINICSSVTDGDDEIMEAVVSADCVVPVTQHNVEEVLPMVVSKDNLKRLADRAKSKQESTKAFGERVLRQTVADLKASHLLKDHLNLVEAAEALIVIG